MTKRIGMLIALTLALAAISVGSTTATPQPDSPLPTCYPCCL